MIHCDECVNFRAVEQLALLADNLALLADSRARRWMTKREIKEIEKLPVVDLEPICFCATGKGMSFLLPPFNTCSTEWGFHPAGGRCGRFEPK